MDDDQQFCLRWNNHQSTLISQFDTLLESETLVDCTLAAEGKYLRAHKVVLSACSPYFEALLKLQYDKHPVFILKDVKYQELRAMMDYMYRGEVNISQDQLGALLKAAESLQIKGLSDSKSGGEKKPTRQPSPQPPPITSKSLTISKQAIKQPASALDSDGLGSPSRGRETSSSPTPRKRKKLRRRSQDDHISDNHDPHSNTSSTHSQPANVNIPLAPISKPALDSLLDPLETLKQVTSSALDHSLLSISAVHKDNAKQEPHSELILEPKAEYVDEDGNDDSVEDLTLDDEEMDDLDQSQAGPSHSGEGSSQGFTWHMGGDRTQDEVFMAAQDAAAGHRDSQAAARNRRVVKASRKRSYVESLVYRRSAGPTTMLTSTPVSSILESCNGTTTSDGGGNSASNVLLTESVSTCTECGKCFTFKCSLEQHTLLGYCKGRKTDQEQAKGDVMAAVTQ